MIIRFTFVRLSKIKEKNGYQDVIKKEIKLDDLENSFEDDFDKHYRDFKTIPPKNWVGSPNENWVKDGDFRYEDDQ